MLIACAFVSVVTESPLIPCLLCTIRLPHDLAAAFILAIAMIHLWLREEDVFDQLVQPLAKYRWVTLFASSCPLQNVLDMAANKKSTPEVSGRPRLPMKAWWKQLTLKHINVQEGDNARSLPFGCSTLNCPRVE